MNRRHVFARARERTPILAAAPDAKGDGTKAVMRLYDVIDSFGGDWGVSAKEFAAALDELPDSVNEIELHINSPGGEVWEGLAILNSLRNHPASVTTVVDGIAASSASFIAMAGDRVLMARNSEMFIHSAWGIVMGNAADMAKMSADLEHESANLASIYAEKAGGTVEDWRALMTAETWFSDSEAVDAGLADEVLGSDPEPATKAKNRFDLSMFNRAGREKAPTPPTPVASASGDSSTHEGSPAVAFSDEGIDTLRQKLGVTDAEADEATILAALDEALNEQSEPQVNHEPAPGTVVVEESQYAALLASAQRGDEARTQQETESRERLVASAVKDGRIPPARKDAWLNMLATDPGSAETLASLKPGLIPVEASGHDQITETTSDDAIYAALFGETKGA